MAEGKITRRGGGVNVKDATATENDVLQGETFYSVDKDKKTGTMTDNGTVNHSLSINGNFTIPQGFHSGSGQVSQSVSTKGAQTFTPGTSNQTISANQFLTGTQTILGDSDLVPSNIRDGTTIFGVTGTLIVPQNYLEFDGVDDYVDLSTTSNLYNLTSEYTVKFLIELTTSNDEILADLGFQSGVSDSGNRGLVFSMSTTTLMYRIQTNQASGFLGSSRGRIEYENNLNINQKYEIIFTRNNSNTKIYIDNNKVFDFDFSGSSFMHSSRKNQINRNSGSLNDAISGYQSGRLYKFFVSNGYDDLNFNNIVSKYELSEGSGTVLTDSVGNKNGTIVGATWGQ